MEFREFLDFELGRGTKQSTVTAYGIALKTCERALGKPLADATERDATGLAKVLRKQYRDSTVKQYARTVRMFWNWTADRDDEGRARLERLASRRGPLGMKQRLKTLAPADILSVDEIQRMADNAGIDRDAAYIAVLWGTGQRVSAVMSLNLGDVRPMKEPPGFEISFNTVKVQGEEHEAWLVNGEADFLRRWLNGHPVSRPDAPLFCTRSGRRLSRDAGLDIVKRAARRVGIDPKRVTNHIMGRHSRATFLVASGMSDANVKAAMGWSPNSPMLGRYARMRRADVKKAVLRAAGVETPEAVAVERGLSYNPSRIGTTIPVPEEPATVQPITPQELAGLLTDPNVQRFLRLLDTARQPPPA